MKESSNRDPKELQAALHDVMDRDDMFEVDSSPSERSPMISRPIQTTESRSNSGAFGKTSSRSASTTDKDPQDHVSGSSAAENEGSAALLPEPRLHRVHQTIPNTPFSVSLISFILGGLFCVSAILALLSLAGMKFQFSESNSDASPHSKAFLVDPRAALYFTAMATFHTMEFWVTSLKNKERLSVDAFLINNGASYWVFHALGLTEYFVRHYFGLTWANFQSEGVYGVLGKIPVFWGHTGWWAIGLPLLVLGQCFRSLAMIHAAQSFSHIVAQQKEREDTHVLVTHGVYSLSRHPSYVGFFYWAIGTQLLLGNVFSTFLFAIVLGRFFQYRIIAEEYHLIRYFGEDYRTYRSKVGTLLPWPWVRL